MNISGKADVLLGLQWGDEGKGKIVDVLTPGYDLIARYQGGPNAGHTLEFDNQRFVLHTIPSGIFHDGCLNIIGNGVVIDPVTFSKEVDSLGISKKQLSESLLVSCRAHLILPSHRLLDMVYEQEKGTAKIGSTLKGIGPAYTDKIARCGLRLADVKESDFQTRYQSLKNIHLKQAKSMGFDKNTFRFDGMEFDGYESLWFEGLSLIDSLKHIECEVFLNQALDNGRKVLAEGAQGTLLDIDFGSYPYVTSSNTITAGACTGLGLAPSRIGEVFGIFKAYCTRVGSGPFPTELFDHDGDLLRKNGNEFGSTTGRPRRCGWLDLPALKYSVMINGVTKLIMTKADVMNDFESIKLCTSYLYEGMQINHPPSTYNEGNLKPSYISMKGWKTDLSSFKSIKELPAALLDYINFIEEYVGVNIEIVSTGPDRSQILF
jgi:adenylosuccinate synthase